MILAGSVAQKKEDGAISFRETPIEIERIENLFSLIPLTGSTALDIGARDGHLSMKLAERYSEVTALDLELPEIVHPGIKCVRGNITHLQFKDSSFELVLCAEVLEHIPPHQLSLACSELARVARDKIVIGVPYKQDTRLGRTDCSDCNKRNPPWGHVNAFNEAKLKSLFPGLRIEKTTYVGRTQDRTNFISVLLMDFARNPYGTYYQDEGCVHCGAKLKGPLPRNFWQKAATFLGHKLRLPLARLYPPRPIWIHIQFSKDRK